MVLVLLTVLLSSAPAPRENPRFVSTSIDRCRLVDRNEAGETSHHCRGVAGWALELIDADDRASINVLPPAAKAAWPLDFQATVTDEFSQLVGRAEWLLEAGTGRPSALIVHLEVNEPVPGSDDPDRTHHVRYFVVAKISTAGACVIAKVPLRSGLTQARVTARLAATRACLSGAAL